jgi:hypothetical protein
MKPVFYARQRRRFFLTWRSQSKSKRAPEEPHKAMRPGQCGVQDVGVVELPGDRPYYVVRRPGQRSVQDVLLEDPIILCFLAIMCPRCRCGRVTCGPH